MATSVASKPVTDSSKTKLKVMLPVAMPATLSLIVRTGGVSERIGNLTLEMFTLAVTMEAVAVICPLRRLWS